MNCIYLKQKINRKLECKKNKNRNIPNDCRNCRDKCFKFYECTKLQKKYTFQERKSPKMHNKSTKLKKLERSRESILTDDMKHCIICGRSPVNKHEIFGGKNRLNSIKYKLVIPLCIYEHHNQIECRGIHFDKRLQKEWHKKGQAAFKETYPNLKFIDIFKKNYF